MVSIPTASYSRHKKASPSRKKDTRTFEAGMLIESMNLGSAQQTPRICGGREVEAVPRIECRTGSDSVCGLGHGMRVVVPRFTGESSAYTQSGAIGPAFIFWSVVEGR